MTNHPKRPKDPEQLAKSIIDIATRRTAPDDDAPESAYTKRTRSGGRKGGSARSAALTPEQWELPNFKPEYQFIVRQYAIRQGPFR
jgi:hypothetical protein